MIVEPTHRVLNRYVQVPECVINRDLYSPPDARRDAQECDLELIYHGGLFHFSDLFQSILREWGKYGVAKDTAFRAGCT